MFVNPGDLCRSPDRHRSYATSVRCAQELRMLAVVRQSLLTGVLQHFLDVTDSFLRIALGLLGQTFDLRPLICCSVLPIT